MRLGRGQLLGWGRFALGGGLLGASGLRLSFVGRRLAQGEALGRQRLEAGGVLGEGAVLDRGQEVPVDADLAIDAVAAGAERDDARAVLLVVADLRTSWKPEASMIWAISSSFAGSETTSCR